MDRTDHRPADILDAVRKQGGEHKQVPEHSAGTHRYSDDAHGHHKLSKRCRWQA